MATVHLHNEAGFAQWIRARTHQLQADEPPDNGGGDTGPSPYELLLSALAACTSLTLRMYADRKGWELGSIHIDARFSRDECGLENIERTVTFGNVLTLTPPLTTTEAEMMQALDIIDEAIASVAAGKP